jgi:hypothetical protein
VTSIHILVVTGGPRLGDMEASAVASVAGAQLSVVSGGFLCLVGLVAIIRAFPELSAFDLRQVAPGVAHAPEPVAGTTPIA